MASSLHAVRAGLVLILTFENEDGFPRLERRLLEHLNEELRRANGDRSLSGAVITGSEKAFAVGAEIGELAQLGAMAAREFSQLGQRVMAEIEESKKPVIAAIRGYCFGGGLDVALACHARIVSEDAQFAHPGGALGIMTGWGGTQRLPRTMRPGARAMALEMFATGCRITAREALQAGLIMRIARDGEVLAEAARLARISIGAAAEHE